MAVRGYSWDLFDSICLMLSWNECLFIVGMEPQVVLFVCLFRLFPSKCRVHVAALSVSSLRTNEQSVADLAKFKDRTGLHTSTNIFGHQCFLYEQLLRYRLSKQVYVHLCVYVCVRVCVCVKTVIASRMWPGCQDQRRLQPGVQDKPSTEDRVPSVLWKAVIRYGMGADRRWPACAKGHLWPFMVIHGRSWSFIVLHGHSILGVIIQNLERDKCCFSWLFEFVWILP